MEKSIILANDISEISRLYEFIEELGNDFSLSPDIVFNLNLVLEEAVVNVINYAYPKEEHQNIYLSARMHEGSIVLVLTDTGKEFDPTAALAMLQPAAELEALEAVRAKSPVAISAGERLYTRFDYNELFRRRACDYIQPDISHAGGIMELKKIAAEKAGDALIAEAKEQGAKLVAEAEKKGNELIEKAKER